MSRSLRAVRLASGHPRDVFQRPAKSGSWTGPSGLSGRGLARCEDTAGWLARMSGAAGCKA